MKIHLLRERATPEQVEEMLQTLGSYIMINPEIRTRYLQDTLPIRLGGIAANLARLASFSANPQSVITIENLLVESRWLIEWTAPDLVAERVDDAARLVDIQRGLTRWYWRWRDIQNDPAQRQQLAAQARAWSEEVLQMSGLLEE
jgi:hypothetical protein